MSQKRRRKLCVNCDGLIDLDVIVCPYCGNEVSHGDLSSQDLDQENEVDSKDISSYQKNYLYDTNLSSLYPPPYQPKNIDMPEPLACSNEKVETQDFLEEEVKKFSLVLPTLLFSLGINVLLFGLYLFAFSKNGEIFIRWNASIWFVYVVIGLPFIFAGYKMLSKSFLK